VTGRASRGLPLGVWALGFGSLFMDSSSELIHSLLPAYLVTTLGASVVTVGIIEGMAEATAAITKVFSGALSDLLGRRKPLVLLGYGLAALTKPFIPLAGSVAVIAAARFVDRVGKGIRGAPRDALVADIVPPERRGAAYGLRQALDSVGAILGPALAMLLLLLVTDDIRSVLWVAVVPAVLAVIVLALFVREPEQPGPHGAARAPLRLADARRLPRRYWLVVMLAAVFTLARFSEAFLLLRAQDLGLDLSHVPLVMIVMNVFYAGAAYPAGLAADYASPRGLLGAGLLLLIAADLMLALATGVGLAFIGAALWGLHMALTQGLLAKLVADTAPSDLRGTAFGLFNLVSGIALLGASVLAGILWSVFGAAATFVGGAGFALAAAVGLSWPWRRPRRGR
jgi:MFS family permease